MKESNQQESLEQEDETKPLGAVFITVILAIIILVSWFGMYALHISRS